MKGYEDSVSQDEGFASGGTFQNTSATNGDEIALRAIDGYDRELRAINKKASEKNNWPMQIINQDSRFLTIQNSHMKNLKRTITLSRFCGPSILKSLHTLSV